MTLSEQDRAFIRELPMMLATGSAVFAVTLDIAFRLRFDLPIWDAIARVM